MIVAIFIIISEDRENHGSCLPLCGFPLIKMQAAFGQAEAACGVFLSVLANHSAL